MICGYFLIRYCEIALEGVVAGFDGEGVLTCVCEIHCCRAAEREINNRRSINLIDY